MSGRAIIRSKINAKANVGGTGGGTPTTEGYWGSFWDTTNQSAADVTQAYAINLNTTDPNSNGVSVVAGNKITIGHTGVYNIQYSIQFVNTESNQNAHKDVNVWLRVNDTGSAGDVADSNSTFTIPERHGTTLDGKLIGVVNYVMKLNAGDYFQVMWQPEITNISIATLPAGTTPTTPVSPGVILTVTQVASTLSGGGGGSGTVTSVGLSAPAAFTVTGSPVTTSGTLAITGAGTTGQYIRGDGTLATFPVIGANDITQITEGTSTANKFIQPAELDESFYAAGSKVFNSINFW